jgi:predicted acyltransferase
MQIKNVKPPKSGTILNRLSRRNRGIFAGMSQAAVLEGNPPPSSRRMASIDVYRGGVMLLMMAEVLSFKTVAKALPGNSFWQFLAYHQTHVPWAGCSLHDMIQPSFTFLVGVVLPFSVAGRQSNGQTNKVLLQHAIKRSVILICLGIFLRSIHSNQTNFTFEDTLTQIGLGYTFLVILSLYSKRIQFIALFMILLGYWAAFAFYPLPSADFDYATAGVAPGWEHNFHGFTAHWDKNTNFAYAFDRWFLNLFPRGKPFLNNNGGYSTLSFIPTLGTMILGLFAGLALIDAATIQKQKIKFLITTGAGLVLLSLLLHYTGINPIVKKIWTPAWVLFSGGLCFWLMAIFYGVIDVLQKKNGSFIFRVIGMNSIAAYVIADGGLRNFITRSLYIHLGQNFDKFLGVAYATVVTGGMTLLLEWLILYWMYKRKIFIKI